MYLLFVYFPFNRLYELVFIWHFKNNDDVPTRHLNMTCTDVRVDLLPPPVGRGRAGDIPPRHLVSSLHLNFCSGGESVTLIRHCHGLIACTGHRRACVCVCVCDVTC